MADDTTSKNKNTDHITPLDFHASHSTLPDTHVWNIEEEEEKECFFSGEINWSIPVVDMDDPSATKLIGRACEEWGAFQLTGHGVPLDLLKEVGVQSRRLFDLPTTQKLKALRSPSAGGRGGGGSGYGQPKISPFFPKQMWHEGFTIAGDVGEHASTLWPHDHLSFCGVMEEYRKKMTTLAERLFISILEWLGVSPEEMSSHCEKEGNNGGGLSFAVQLNSYPPCPEPEKAMGLVPHTDTSFLTLLHQVQRTTEGGLQVFREGVGWVRVAPTTDTSFVVNIGDLFHIISNGRLHPVLHRATVGRNDPRHTFAYFYFPKNVCNLSPLPKLVDGCMPPMYREVSVKEYVKLKDKHLRNALSLLKN